MSWFKDRESRSWLQSLCARVLCKGIIPKHLAVIMDGNRRYAVKEDMKRIDGHIKGFEKLAQMLDWCLMFGISEVTVYAFSVENFKRSADEVDGLMQLARDKFETLLKERDELHKEGVCIRIWGDTSLLSPDLQRLIAQVQTLTADNNKAFLNICLSYSSTEEICHSMRQIADGVHEGELKQEDINEDTLSQFLYSGPSNHPDPDLLVRTSGEVRLSDFLLWQSAYSCISFVHVLWPNFTFWHLCAAVLFYQINYNAIQEMRDRHRGWVMLQQSSSSISNGTLGDVAHQHTTSTSRSGRCSGGAVRDRRGNRGTSLDGSCSHSEQYNKGDRVLSERVRRYSEKVQLKRDAELADILKSRVRHNNNRDDGH